MSRKLKEAYSASISAMIRLAEVSDCLDWAERHIRADQSDQAVSELDQIRDTLAAQMDELNSIKSNIHRLMGRKQ